MCCSREISVRLEVGSTEKKLHCLKRNQEDDDTFTVEFNRFTVRK